MIEPTTNTFRDDLTESLGYFQKANQLKLAQKYEEAAEKYHQAINCTGGNITESTLSWYYHNLGEVLAKLGQWSEAVANYRRACELNPKSAFSYSNLAEGLVKLELYDEAVTCFSQAITIIGKGKLVTTLYYNLGRVLHQLGRLDEAIDSYENSIQSEPNFTAVYLHLGALYYQKAITIMAGNDLSKQQLDELYCQILSKLDNETFIQAVYLAYLDREVDETGKDFYLHRLEAEIYTRQELIAQIRLSLEFRLVSQHFSEQEQVLDQCFCQILANLDNAAFVEAVYKSYLRREADEGGWKIHLQRLEERVDTRQQFIRHIRGSREFALGSKQFKKHPIVVKVKRGYLDQAQSNYEFVQKHKHITFSANEQLGEIYKQLGIVLAEMGELENAIAYYEKTIVINSEKNPKPDDWEIYYNLAKIYIKLSFHDYAKNQILASIDKTAKAIDFYKIQLQSHPLSQTKLRFWPCHYLNSSGIWPLIAIGHIAMIIDLYLKMSKLGWYSEYEIILLAPIEHVVNLSMLNYWQDYICVVFDPELIDRFLPLAQRLQLVEPNTFYIKLPTGKMVDLMCGMSVVQRQWEAEKRPSLLSLSESDRERGWRCLTEIGVPRNAWFVSLHVRESGYWRAISSDFSDRDADIDTYIPVIESIVARGGWVIRMGDPTMKPLPKIKNTFDYVHSPLKSDWMDVFLSTQCHFFLGTSSGLITVPWVFNTPSLMTNTFPLASIPTTSNSMFIPKLYWSETEQRYLSFLEMLSSDCFFNFMVLTDHPLKIKVIDNTPEEINDSVLEMLDRLEGKINYTTEDETLWERFQSLPSPYGASCFNSRMGRDFLRKYAGLLPE